MTAAELPPDLLDAPAADLPKHAKERLLDMRSRGLFSSDLSVSEFLLVKQAGFEPLGLVMGSSIYRIAPVRPAGNVMAEELTVITQALYHCRELAMTRMEEEAQALGADGVIGVRLKLNLHAWGQQIMEFVAVGTAIRHLGGKPYRNHKGMPFTSDLSGQDFWTLLHAGWRPVGMVMGNCAYYVGPPAAMGFQGSASNDELPEFTHAMYDAREEAMERLQAEAEDLQAEGVVGVTIKHQEHAFTAKWQAKDLQNFRGELLEFFVVGTAVIRYADPHPLAKPQLFIRADGGGER